MQVTTDGFVGAGTGCPSNDCLRCRDREIYKKKIYCSKYYSNTIQGIEANVKDGFYALNTKCCSRCCYDRGETAHLDNGVYEEDMGWGVVLYSKAEACYGSDGETYDSKIQKVEIGELELTCDEFRVVDAVWRYNGRSIYPEGSGQGNDYLRYVADMLDDIGSLFGWSMTDKQKWQNALNAVADSAKVIQRIHSPVLPQILDEEGRVTGVVDGEVREGIPFSSYDEEAGVIVIPFCYEPFGYQVVGTEIGTYGAEFTYAQDGNVKSFSATDIPIVPDARHGYGIDWDALSQGEPGVTVEVDSDGDGNIDHTFTSDEELTREEFIQNTGGAVGGTAFPTDKLGLMMPWLVGAAALIVLCGAVLVAWNRRTKGSHS